MLWGKRFTPIDFEGNEDLDCIVMACTDGSTYRDKPHSGAGIAYIHDNATEHELFLHSYGWKIEDNDNFAAELAAIAKCIHSVPVTVALDIRTDSQASIDAINKYNDRPMNGAPLNFSARTYLSTIANAMTIREENGALTRFKHVKSHTGNRDKASIGNEAADRKAKQAALEEKTDTTDDITHFEHELSYVVFTEDHNTHPNTKKWTPIHGNIRQELKNHHKKTLIEQWANTKDRPKAAELINKAKNKILELIDEIWKEPTTLKIQFLLHVLNQADRTWPRPICERCMKNIPETPRHILECPANADIFNQASKKIGKILEIYDPEDEMDIAFHTEENSPFGGTYDAVEKLTRKILEPHRLHSTRRAEFEISEGQKVTIPGQMASLILRLFEQKERGEET
jgi:ribonuclease HI